MEPRQERSEKNNAAYLPHYPAAGFLSAFFLWSDPKPIGSGRECLQNDSKTFAS